MTDDQVAAIKSAATALNADVYYVSGAIAAPRMSTSGRKPNGRADATTARRGRRAVAPYLREEAERSRRRDRCVLVLPTSGGDADAAY